MQKLSGQIKIPGDKSITHRALILAAIGANQQEITIYNWLPSLDCIATRDALAAMGVEFASTFDTEQGTQILIKGVGLYGLEQPTHMLDAGNSGTTMRLLTGVLAAQRFSSSITGDVSLCKRPMARIAEPLCMMGAKINATANNYAPLYITGGQQLSAIEYHMPMASAQVKSALLLASLYAEGNCKITVPSVCRDHTEILLNNLNAEIHIPSDISSAAFFIVGATIAQDSDIWLPNIGINPTRAGILDILRQMGANIALENLRTLNGELRADLRVKSAKRLTATTIPTTLIANIIDELPIICLAAACAEGTTIIRGASELRYKESDRIKLMVNGLRTLGIQTEEFADGLAITGGRIGGGNIETNGDHRIAMTFKIAQLVAEQQIIIQDSECIATSFPDFTKLLEESVYA